MKNTRNGKYQKRREKKSRFPLGQLFFLNRIFHLGKKFRGRFGKMTEQEYRELIADVAAGRITLNEASKRIQRAKEEWKRNRAEPDVSPGEAGPSEV
jgi:hypothetical protein